MKKLFVSLNSLSLSALILMSPFLMGADYLGGKQIERSKSIMGTMMDITIFESTLTRENASRIIDGAFEMAVSLEGKASDSDENSIVSRVRRAKAGEVIPLDDDTLNILKQAVRISLLSEGAYDVTAAPLKKMWLQAKDEGEPPSKEAIKSALTIVSYQNIQLDELDKKLTIKKEGVSLYLADSIQAYAVDKVADYLKDNGVTSALISFAGNSRYLGNSREGYGWRVGIEHPRKIDEYAAIIEVAEPRAFSVTSDYDDFFMFKGKRYSIFCNPQTGQPEDNHVSSVTIIAEKALLANVVSQAVFVLGAEKGYELVDKLKEDGVEAICIEENPKDRFVLSGSEGAQPLIKEVTL